MYTISGKRIKGFSEQKNTPLGQTGSLLDNTGMHTHRLSTLEQLDMVHRCMSFSKHLQTEFGLLFKTHRGNLYIGIIITHRELVTKSKLMLSSEDFVTTYSNCTVGESLGVDGMLL